ncbi:hypothetical protein [Bacteriovorax sp. Seq25_V]|uniref:hypothetical protein n=1 Tax=Bacteriovorax sp. Seq25_V TaxID=1201288 RepID=UPI000389FC40|nr:hypothetical protein [Bacteriovorax sp. Seq25_V]EQC46113.1 hypothetical protein M900_1650 [Bacteriovorax sp. Seq25_V]
MKIPILEEIKITTLDMSELRALFTKFKVGNTPCYTDLSNLSAERLIEVTTVLELVLNDMNISPKFPYPYYLITPHLEVNTFFPLLKSVERIPNYFKIESKRVTNKEQKILDKIEVICSQIQNQEVQSRLEEYRMSILPQRFIKSLAKEGMFLEKVLKQLSGES